jgi:hypothetical protein
MHIASPQVPPLLESLDSIIKLSSQRHGSCPCKRNLQAEKFRGCKAQPHYVEHDPLSHRLNAHFWSMEGLPI